MTDTNSLPSVPVLRVPFAAEKLRIYHAAPYLCVVASPHNPAFIDTTLPGFPAVAAGQSVRILDSNDREHVAVIEEA